MQDESQRIRKHQQLLRMISDYNLSQEELDYLETVKRSTEIEIASRYAKTPHNQTYKFPLFDEQEEQFQEHNKFTEFDKTFYDLRSQNELKPHLSGDILISRRVKSLGQEKNNKKMANQIQKQLRKRPKERNSRRQGLMFPELKRQFRSQKVLKTELSIKHKQFSIKKSRISPLKAAREEISKEKTKQALGAKLLTEGNTISFGKVKVMINQLKISSPLKTSRKEGF